MTVVNDVDTGTPLSSKSNANVLKIIAPLLESSSSSLASSSLLSFSSLAGTCHSNKASPWKLDSWCKLLLTLDGRDKATKVLQYMCRLLAWYFAGAVATTRQKKIGGSSANTSAVAAAAAAASLVLTNWKTSLSTSRKAFRLGRSVLEWQKFQSLGIGEWIRCFLVCRHNHFQSSHHRHPEKTLQPNSPPQKDISIPDSNKTYDWSSLWILLVQATKLWGLGGFWAADNASFLIQSSGLTNSCNSNKEWVARTSALANQCYFVGAVAGLVVNIEALRKHHQQQHQQSAHCYSVTEGGAIEDEKLRVEQEKKFTLFMSLLKSCCDILVFSNNPGVDLWRRRRQPHGGPAAAAPMHEGFHCLCGLVSAGTVLYANYPTTTGTPTNKKQN